MDNDMTAATAGGAAPRGSSIDGRPLEDRTAASKMVSRERTLHYWLARLTSYPRWVSTGSIDSHAELQRISREDYETIQAVLRGE